MDEIVEQIPSSEQVFRRIPPQWVSGGDDDGRPNIYAFKPLMPDANRAGDLDGISVTRGRVRTPTEAARNPTGKAYRVAALNVGHVRALRRHGNPIESLDVVHSPLRDDTEHAVIPEINCVAYSQDKNRILEWMKLLAHHVAVVVPFHADDRVT